MLKNNLDKMKDEPPGENDKVNLFGIRNSERLICNCVLSLHRATFAVAGFSFKHDNYSSGIFYHR